MHSTRSALFRRQSARIRRAVRPHRCQPPLANLRPAPRAPQEQWPKYEAKMKAAGLSDAAIGAFKGNFDQLVAGVTGLVRLAVG